MIEALLSTEQEGLLKRTRETLGQLRDAMSDSSTLPDERKALADSIRQVDELFLLVVAGEFNAGKSAFVNAIVGQNIMTEGVTPTTSQIHLLKYGEKAEKVPGEKGVWIQTAPVELLKKISIVDTPGTNAIVREHEALTSEFIPRSDLVLFLTSADRPFSESERNFLNQIKEWGKKIVMVINKIDIMENETELNKVIEFVKSSAEQLMGEPTVVFPVSARKAQKSKMGQPHLWPESRFEALEKYILETLDDGGRFQLKLMNPLGVGLKLVKKQLASIEFDLGSLNDDKRLLKDIDSQMSYYNEDMERNFKIRIAEIESLLFNMEKKGNEFLDQTIRFGRIPDLMRSRMIQQNFETEVVGDLAEKIDERVSALVDWLIEQDLRQWTAVAEHLTKRRIENQARIVGDNNLREGTLAYDRQRLVESINSSTRQAVATYNKHREASYMAEEAKQAVFQTGMAVTGVGIGTAIALTTQAAMLDVTGIVLGLAAATVGLFIIPMQRRKAKQQLEQKISELREKLSKSLTDQFHREMKRSHERITETIAPFSRFVRSEWDKFEGRETTLNELEAHLIGLKSQLQIYK